MTHGRPKGTPRAARIGSWVTTVDEPNKLVRRCEVLGEIIICYRDRSQPPGQRWRWTRRDGPGGTVLAEGTARTAADAWYAGASMPKRPTEPERRLACRGGAMTTRTLLLTIRMTPEELASLRAQAAANGQTVADLVRLAVRLHRRHPDPSSTDTDG